MQFPSISRSVLQPAGPGGTVAGRPEPESDELPETTGRGSYHYGIARMLILENLHAQREAALACQGRTGGAGGELTLDEARELISEKGYFGVQQTLTRIVKFVVAIAGNNPAKLEQVRRGIDAGYREVLAMGEGSMPELCRQTHLAVRYKLDAWAANLEVALTGQGGASA